MKLNNNPQPLENIQLHHSEALPVSIEADDTPFPIDALPAKMRRAVEETSRVRGIPLALPASVALGAVSVALGKGVKMCSGGDHKVAGNIYQLILADSGQGKGVSYNDLFSPVVVWESKMVEWFNSEIRPQLEAKKEIADSRRLSLLAKIRKDGGAPSQVETDELKSLKREILDAEKGLANDRSIMTSNTTQEALIEALAVRPDECYAIVAEEAKETLEVINGKYDKGSGSSDTMLTVCWTGSNYASDRKKENGSFSIGNPCLSMMLMTQPTVGERFLTNGDAHESGFFARMLFTYATGEMPTMSVGGNTYDTAVKGDWECLLREILDDLRPVKETPTILTITAEQEKHLVDWVNPKILETRTSLLANKPFVARLAENCYKIILLLHVAKNGSNAIDEPVSLESFKNGTKIMDWFIEQHNSVTYEIGCIRATARYNKLVSILEGSGGEMTKSLLKRNHNFQWSEVLKLVAESGGRLVTGRIKGKTKPTLLVSMVR